MFNIASVLAARSEKKPDHTALILKDSKEYRQWTFSEIEANMHSYAIYLSGHIKKGERVVLMVKPSMEFICLTFALFAIGAVVILIDPGMGYKNLLRCIGSVKPTAFVGISKAHLFRTVFARYFNTVTTNICVGLNPLGLLGKSVPKPIRPTSPFNIVETNEEDLAAIIFTTGSTGPPKGVQYQHGIFKNQLSYINQYYGISSNDIDQPAFPLFGLFSIALGATAVIPDMDPTKPAQVHPAKFIRSIQDKNVTYSFGSPAIWNVVSTYCIEKNITLPSLKKVLMAGAPVPGELIKRLKKILPGDAEIHTPYGATESLPIVSITGSEIINDTWFMTQNGKGTCVGKPLPGIEIKIIPVTDGPVQSVNNCLPEGQIGEIVVKGPVVTRAYDNNKKENINSKIQEDNGFWHRIGDVGYLDEKGRLWFCGRKAHRVITMHGTLYTICCEAIFNEHPLVYRSALVGIGLPGNQTPVLIVEPFDTVSQPETLFKELREMALEFDHTATITNFLIHKSFPVDIRHNAKIFREKLALWAENKVDLKVCA